MAAGLLYNAGEHELTGSAERIAQASVRAAALLDEARVHEGPMTLQTSGVLNLGGGQVNRLCTSREF